MKPEWSYLFDVDGLETSPAVLTLVPDERERLDLARRLGLVSLDSLEARLTVQRERRSVLIHITGSFKAQVTQKCIVTDAPVSSTISEELESWYSDHRDAIPFIKERKERLGRQSGELEMPMMDESEDPEPVVNGKIDLGELVAQNLSLAINPYPQCAELVERDNQPDEDGEIIVRSERENPFTALKDWKFGKDQDG